MTTTPETGATMLGEMVLYTLDEADADRINAWRANFARGKARNDSHKHPHDPGGHEDGTTGSPGFIAHVGMPVAAGDVFPAIVTIVGNPGPGHRLCLDVVLHGSDTEAVDDVPEGTGPGTWRLRGRP